MTQEGPFPPPSVMWAQRSNILFVTICLEDCKNPTIKIEPDKIYFKGIGGTDRKTHEVTINLHAEINPDKTVQNLKDRMIELVLTKKIEGPFWPRLTVENQKFHWLKSDFNKWVDEDDSEEEGGAENRDDLSQMMQQFGNLGGMRGGGAGGEGIMKPNFGDLEEEEDEDSDDDEMPELE